MEWVKRYSLLASLLSAMFWTARTARLSFVVSRTTQGARLCSKCSGRMGQWEALNRDIVYCTLEAKEDVEEGEKSICVDDSASLKRTPWYHPLLK